MRITDSETPEFRDIGGILKWHEEWNGTDAINSSGVFLREHSPALTKNAFFDLS